MRYYEDLVVGHVDESEEQVVTEADILEFARRYDPQYFHADPARAQDSRFGGIIASGIHVAALWRQRDHSVASDVAWICGIAWEEVRWPHPVRAGDRVRSRSEYLHKRVSDSDASRGVVTCRYTLLNQSDRIVFTCRSINLIERRP